MDQGLPVPKWQAMRSMPGNPETNITTLSVRNKVKIRFASIAYIAGDALPRNHHGNSMCRIMQENVDASTMHSCNLRWHIHHDALSHISPGHENHGPKAFENFAEGLKYKRKRLYVLWKACQHGRWLTAICITEQMSSRCQMESVLKCTAQGLLC
jgi:hypothetical protein